MSQNFHQLSYKAHEEQYSKKSNLIKRLESKGSIDYWRHSRMYNLLNPLLTDNDYSWLTVGDGIGTDANWLIDKGHNAVATDIADTGLVAAKNAGFITDFSKENAEKLSFADNQFDYILCKESYHHFPRPYLALYEMLRVAKYGVVLIEPGDIGIQMPLMMFLKNMLDRLSPYLIDKIWKNRFSFETVGNFVYKTSEREFEKVAMGMGLPFLAFKGINDHYTTKIDLSQPTTNTRILNQVKSKITKLNLLSKLGIIPYQIQCSIVFNEMPSKEVMEELGLAGYKCIKLPINPYL